MTQTEIHSPARKYDVVIALTGYLSVCLSSCLFVCLFEVTLTHLESPEKSKPLKELPSLDLPENKWAGHLINS